MVVQDVETGKGGGHTVGQGLNDGTRQLGLRSEDGRVLRTAGSLGKIFSSSDIVIFGKLSLAV
jgi:hypothetical protein